MTTQELLQRAKGAKSAMALAGTQTKNKALLAMADALEQFGKEPSVKMKVSAGSLGPIIFEADGRNDHAMVLPVRLKEASRAA